MTPPSALEERLAGTRAAAVREEYLSNSAYFPVANILFEWLREGWSAFVRSPDPYALLATGFVQAWFLGSWRHAGRPRPFLGNLIGPAFYTVVEGAIEGPRFFGAARAIREALAPRLAPFGLAAGAGDFQVRELSLKGMAQPLRVRVLAAP